MWKPYNFVYSSSEEDIKSLGISSLFVGKGVLKYEWMDNWLLVI